MPWAAMPQNSTERKDRHMVLLPLLELAAVAIVFLTLVTQIVMPALRGTPLFPFRRTERHLSSDLERAHEAVLEEALRTKIEKRLGEAERLRQRRRVVGNTGPADVPQASGATEDR